MLPIRAAQAIDRMSSAILTWNEPIDYRPCATRSAKMGTIICDNLVI